MLTISPNSSIKAPAVTSHSLLNQTQAKVADLRSYIYTRSNTFTLKDLKERMKTIEALFEGLEYLYEDNYQVREIKELRSQIEKSKDLNENAIREYEIGTIEVEVSEKFPDVSYKEMTHSIDQLREEIAKLKKAYNKIELLTMIPLNLGRITDETPLVLRARDEEFSFMPASASFFSKLLHYFRS